MERKLVFLDTTADYPHNGVSGLCFDEQHATQGEPVLEGDVTVSVLAAPAALAQEEYLELLREDLKTGKVALDLPVMMKRKEDARFIRGKGTYVDDVVMALFL